MSVYLCKCFNYESSIIWCLSHWGKGKNCCMLSVLQKGNYLCDMKALNVAKKNFFIRVCNTYPIPTLPTFLLGLSNFTKNEISNLKFANLNKRN